jgi:hypothetical protein
MRRVLAAVTSLAIGASLATVGACVGTTGSNLVQFQAYASGPRTMDPSKPFEFDSGRGFHVVLTKARLHVGGLYLNRSQPISGAQATSCILPGIYVAQVVRGLDVDVLSPTPQPFPVAGEGSADHAITGEVWLNGGDIDALDDSTVILDVAGTATKGADVYPFAATYTIGTNRALPPLDKALPGTNPICKQRIATPIAVDVTPSNGGALYLEIDPSGWFSNVDFAQVPEVQTSPPQYRFTDSSSSGTDSASRNLFNALRASDGVYTFTFH